MDRLKHGALLANVCAWNQSQSANQPGAQIRYDIAVKVFQQHYVKLFRAHNQLHTSVVDDLIVGLDGGILGGYLPEAIQEEPVRQFHDVRFVTAGYFLAILTRGIFESE